MDGDCSHEIKRRFILGRKAVTNLDSILKSRDITLPTKIRIVKAKVFPVVMYGCESWTIKKSEHWRTDAFKLWYWGRVLRVPWTARRLNQSILKDINPEYSLERLMWELKLQYFGHLMQRVDLLEKTLMLGKIEDRKGRGWQRIRWLEDITDSMDMFEQTQGDNEDRRAWCTAVHGATKRWTWLSQWTTTNTNEARGQPVSDIKLSDYALPPNKAPEVDTISVKDCLTLCYNGSFVDGLNFIPGKTPAFCHILIDLHINPPSGIPPWAGNQSPITLLCSAFQGWK